MNEPIATVTVKGSSVNVYRATKGDLYRCRNCRHLMPPVAGCKGRWCKKLFFATRANYVCYRHEKQPRCAWRNTTTETGKESEK